MLICEQLDSSDSESFDKLIGIIQQFKIDKEILQNTHFEITKYPTGLLDLSNEILNYLQIEQHLSERDFSNQFHTISFLKHYCDEACLIYTVVEKYLEKRSKDNYKEVLYKDSIQLMQLRLEKSFIIYSLMLVQLQEYVDELSFDLFLEGLQKKLQLNAQIKFASLRVRQKEILEHSLLLIDELRENKQIHKQKYSSSQSVINNNKSLITVRQQKESQQQIYQSSQSQWMFTELQNNQVFCRELIPNLRFIIKSYVKSFQKNKDDSPKKYKNSSIFDLKNRFSVGSQRVRNGFIDLPNLGPMEILMSTQIFPKQKLNDFFDDEQLKHTQIITSQIDSLLNEELLINLTGIEMIDIDSKSESTISRATMQQVFKQH
ncbi:unnamed protein product [Paramecium sonneborni]|uniref:Uncharacterized protein n=1 Tax=Paramecium sonneborni TaxID=65129 RepID=A0A8S1MPF3_9CILI|nr:unnamed protein product [Paramecium sonneborni]